MISLGTYLGILVDAKFFKGSHRTLNDTSVIKTIFRFSFTAAVTIPFVLLSLFQMQNEDKLFNKVVYFFVLPCFSVTFIYFGFSRLLFKRLKLVTSDVIDVKAGKLYVSDMSGYQEYSFDEDRGIDGGEQPSYEERMDFTIDGS